MRGRYCRKDGLSDVAANVARVDRVAPVCSVSHLVKQRVTKIRVVAGLGWRAHYIVMSRQLSNNLVHLQSCRDVGLKHSSLLFFCCTGDGRRGANLVAAWPGHSEVFMRGRVPAYTSARASQVRA